MIVNVLSDKIKHLPNVFQMLTKNEKLNCNVIILKNINKGLTEKIARLGKLYAQNSTADIIMWNYLVYIPNEIADNL